MNSEHQANKPGGIGRDRAELDALQNQVAVDTAIIRAKNVTIQRLRAALEDMCTCAQFGPMTICPACKVLNPLELT